MGAGQPGRRHASRSASRSSPPATTRAGARHGGAARGRPRLQHHRHRRRRTPRCTGRCSTAATCCSSTSAAPAAPSRSTARRCRTSRATTRSPPAQCGASLGARADDYSTALSADDLAAVIDALGLGQVDVYGDSYGTFFAQVFAGRHPEQVRSVVLDSAYPAYGEDAWYATQGPAMRDVVRRRLPADAGLPRRGPAVPADAAAGAGRGPREAVARARRYDADGRRMRVTVDGAGLAAVAFGATYTPGVLPRAHRRPALRRCPATAGRCCGWSPRRPAATPTPGRSGPTARASTPRSPATTTRSSTT